MVEVEKINDIINSLQKDSQNLALIGQLCSEFDHIGSQLKDNSKNNEQAIRKIDQAIHELTKSNEKYAQIISSIGTATIQLDKSIRSSASATNTHIDDIRSSIISSMSQGLNAVNSNIINNGKTTIDFISRVNQLNEKSLDEFRKEITEQANAITSKQQATSIISGMILFVSVASLIILCILHG